MFKAAFATAVAAVKNEVFVKSIAIGISCSLVFVCINEKIALTFAGVAIEVWGVFEEVTIRLSKLARVCASANLLVENWVGLRAAWVFSLLALALASFFVEVWASSIVEAFVDVGADACTFVPVPNLDGSALNLFAGNRHGRDRTVQVEFKIFQFVLWQKFIVFRNAHSAGATAAAGRLTINPEDCIVTEARGLICAGFRFGFERVVIEFDNTRSLHSTAREDRFAANGVIEILSNEGVIIGVKLEVASSTVEF